MGPGAQVIGFQVLKDHSEYSISGPKGPVFGYLNPKPRTLGGSGVPPHPQPTTSIKMGAEAPTCCASAYAAHLGWHKHMQNILLLSRD